MIKNSLLIAISLLVTLVGVEIYLRISAPKRIEPTACRTAHKQLHHFLKPATTCKFKTPEWDVTYAINSWGLRDQEYTLEKPKNTYRVLVTGDSFTEGFGVESDEAFANLLEIYLDQTANTKVEVINAGVSSWSPTPEYVYLVNYGVNLAPDLVMTVLTISDFGDEYFYEQLLTEQGKTLLMDESGEVLSIPQDAVLFTSQKTETLVENINDESAWEKFKTILRDNLKIYRFLSLKVRTMLGLYNPVTGVHPDDIGNVARDQMAVSRLEVPTEYDEALQKIQLRLQQTKRLLDKYKVDWLIVLLPHPHMVNGQEWAKGRQFFGFKPGIVYSRRGFDNLAIWANQWEIDVLDLTPTLEVASKSQRLYFNNDGHLNVKGHDVVARALHTFLTPKFYEQ